MADYQAFRVELKDKIAHVQINRPEKRNAMNSAFWTEIIEIFTWADRTDDVRVVVLSGAGEHFSSGIDLNLLAQAAALVGKDVGRSADALRRKILELQASFNAVDRCRKPVLAAIQLLPGWGHRPGLGLRHALRLPRREVRNQGDRHGHGRRRWYPAASAAHHRRRHHARAGFHRAHGGERGSQRIGLVNRVYDDKDSLLAGVMQLAADIAAKSPIAIRGTKEMIRYMRDHRVDDGLEYIATWNAAMLQSADLRIAMAAHMSKQRRSLPTEIFEPPAGRSSGMAGVTSLNLVRDELFATMAEAEQNLEHFIAERQNGSLLQQAVAICSRCAVPSNSSNSPVRSFWRRRSCAWAWTCLWMPVPSAMTS